MQVLKKSAAFYKNKQRYQVLKFRVFLFWKDAIFRQFFCLPLFTKVTFYLILYFYLFYLKLRNLWKIAVKKFILVNLQVKGLELYQKCKNVKMFFRKQLSRVENICCLLSAALSKLVSYVFTEISLLPHNWEILFQSL